MEYLEQPTYHHFHHDQMSGGMNSPYGESQQFVHGYGPVMVQQSSPLMAMSNSATKTNETKPRLGKEEVEILEREFKKNPKPTTQTKRQYADDMGVDLARINNWFQNRRAKRKQEKKQEAYEAHQAQDGLGYQDPSSPDLADGSPYFGDTAPMHPELYANARPLPQAVASYDPQYTDPVQASMESLQRTLLAATRASPQEQDFQVYPEQQNSFVPFNNSFLHDSSDGDRAQFPATESLSHFGEHHPYTYSSTANGTLFSTSNHTMTDIQASPVDTPTAFGSFSAGPPRSDSDISHIASFPSELLSHEEHDGLSSYQHDHAGNHSFLSSSPDGLPIGFQLTTEPEQMSHPAPSIPFKSPPPMDIASRRKNAVKPAALTADTMKSRPAMGPRTFSHQADGFRRPADIPHSPMRRVMSAGGLRQGVSSGRIIKSGVESAQRSPINFGGFNDAGAFLEHNQHTIRNPSLVGSALNSNLAPPTPMSPRDMRGGEMSFVKREDSLSSASPPDRGQNYVFSAAAGSFTALETQNLASPPETPQAHLPIHSLVNNGHVNNWNAGFDFDIPDTGFYTPQHEHFPHHSELQMPVPSYLTVSQPATPGFNQPQFPSFLYSENFAEQDSNQFASSNHFEQSFPDANQQFLGRLSSSASPPQKTFQFSNSTPADYGNLK